MKAKNWQICIVCQVNFHCPPSQTKKGRKHCSNRCSATSRIRSLADRFWEKVDKETTPDSCWPWTGATNSGGYGVIGEGGHNGKMKYASHVAFEIQNGPIPQGHNVLHRCDNPPCVRGEHLFSGTQRDNALDAIAKGRAYLPTAPIPRGEKHPWAKLSDLQFQEIFQRSQHGENLTSLAKEFGVTYSLVYQIKTERKRRHLTAVSLL